MQQHILLTGEIEVKDTWQYLRDRYTKERKMQLNSNGSKHIEPSWIYKQLDFLDKHIKRRQ